jgi:transposase
VASDDDLSMALSYLPVDRDQLFLVPPDMRDWLPERHLAFFVLDVVERVDTSVLHALHPNDGAGRRAYDPDMLLALLVYSYCTGERSSRQIERLCEVDVAYRVICANQVPDHTTIARFRGENNGLAVTMFTDVLALCAKAGMVRVGVVAVDGTKMRADASAKANRTRAQIEAEVAAMMGEAEACDKDEDAKFGSARGDELPDELADPHTRKAHLDAALRALKAEEDSRKAAETATSAARAATEAEAASKRIGVPGRRPRCEDPLAQAEADLAAAVADLAARNADWRVRRQAARAAGRPDPIRPTHHRAQKARSRLARIKASPPPPLEPKKPPQVNTTDPDARIMKTQGGWLQGYNAQAAVNEQGIVLCATVTKDHNDTGQCLPMMAAIRANLDAAGIIEPIGTMLFDAGYLTEENLLAEGPDRLIATAKSWKLRREAREHGFAEGDPPPGSSPIEAMEHRLRTEEGAALYGLRQCTIEPAFGDIKENRGYRRFVRRGLTACDAEWKLICATKNIAKMFRAGAVLPAHC